MGFFDPIPPAEPLVEQPQPEWSGPPEGVLGGVLALQLALARTDRVLLAATDIAVYPNGLEFSIRGLLRDGPQPGEYRPFLLHEEDPRTMLRVGALYPDGRRASNVGRAALPEGDGEPTGPILWARGGGGGERSFNQGWWLWPLPPPGPLVLVVEWPAYEVPESRATIDAGLIEDARSRIQEVWPSSPAAGGYTSWSSYGVRTESAGGDAPTGQK
jgi:hypothetical protein